MTSPESDDDDYTNLCLQYERALEVLRLVYEGLEPDDPNTEFIEQLMEDLEEVL